MITINNKSFLKSKLDFNYYAILQIIFEKKSNFFDSIKSTQYFADAMVFLMTKKFIKYSGFSSIYDPEIELSDLVLLKKATLLFEGDLLVNRAVQVEDWISQYRLKFKGIKTGSMGDPNSCLKKMQLFIKNNPKYTKKNILDATDKYISNTEPIYTMQADYFISKVDNNKIATSKLLVILEEIELGEFIDNNSSNLNTMI